ncbi:MAG TPA: glycoside hydrolase family 31 protein [Candidatus Limiplasma stercoravium]|nr:glycoside hydrolase family 31 protein [Candidatus Limiplasma stercoravium]
MNPFEQNGQQLVWRNRGETLTLTPWGQDSLRVCAALMREPEDTRWALMDPQPAGDVEIVLGQERASIRCGRLTAVVELDGWQKHARLRFLNQRGETLLSETAVANALALSSRRYEPHLGGDYAIVQTFEGQPGERIWGMGQYQEERVDWKGCTLELAHRNSQASVPFAVSSLGYGFLWHNPAIGEVTFGENRTTWRADSSRQLDYWITCGDTPREISLHYAAATGFAPLMPEYGLGFWQCKLRYWNQEQLLSVAREYKRRGLPIDVIVCDFFHWPRMGDYRFDPEFFPDPQGMARELREMGIELMVSVWPQVALTSENYPEMLQQGLLVRAEYGEQIGMRFVEDSMFFDATNPRARRYVWDKCKQNYFDKGVRLFWLDEAEPEYGTYDFKAYRYFLGSNQQVGNVYPQRYARGFYEGLSASGVERPLCLLRCAWAGSQRYGALVWSGDVMSTWEDFRKQVCAGLSMGFAGIPWWTTDIGGFHGGNPDDPDFRELLVRWFQWACYCPVMRLHGDRRPAQPVLRADGTPCLNSGADNEVWSFGEEAYPILVKYMRRREALRPYVRGLMLQAHETGAPLLRAMFYAFPGEAALDGLKDQYMFGEEYLVAPVLTPGARSRDVVLPGGWRWENVDTGEILEGGQTVRVPAPLDVIPVLRRR